MDDDCHCELLMIHGGMRIHRHIHISVWVVDMSGEYLSISYYAKYTAQVDMTFKLIIIIFCRQYTSK